MRATGAVLALLIGLVGLAAPIARADEAESADAQMKRLEALLEAQARQLEAMRAELERLKAAERAPARSVPGGAESSPPPPLPHSAVPSAVSAPVDPYAGQPIVRATDTGTLDLQSAGASLIASKGAYDSTLRWGGYLTVEYVANTKENSYFDLHRFVLDAQVQISECIDLKCEIEIEHGGATPIFDGEVEIEHMDVVFRLADCFNPKVGALLIPMARFNQYHDDPYNDFTNRPWTAVFLVPTGFGQPGVGAEGVFNLGGDSRLTYDVVLSHGYRDDFTPNAGVASARQPWRADENEGKQVWGRVAYLTQNRAFDFFEAGASATWGIYDESEENALFGYALDLTIRKGPFEFRGEYVRMNYDRNASDPVDAVEGQDALWLELAYHFFPPFLCGCDNCLVTPTSHFTLAGRYQTMDLDDNRSGATFNDDLTGYGIALNYRITESSVIRIDHTWLEPENEEERRELTVSFSTYF